VLANSSLEVAVLELLAALLFVVELSPQPEGVADGAIAAGRERTRIPASNVRTRTPTACGLPIFHEDLYEAVVQRPPPEDRIHQGRLAEPLVQEGVVPVAVRGTHIHNAHSYPWAHVQPLPNEQFANEQNVDWFAGPAGASVPPSEPVDWTLLMVGPGLDATLLLLEI
jgi:hypothetical protein